MLKSTIHSIIAIGKRSIGLLLFIVCSIAIYEKVLINEHWVQYSKIVQKQLFIIPSYQWGILLFLMCFNFFIESVKWKIAVASTNPISIVKSIQSVFVGQAFAFFTPNRIGEFVGRTLFLETGNKMMGMAQMAWAAYAQLLVTICVGVLAIYLNLSFYGMTDWFWWVKMLSPGIGLLAIFLFFYKNEWKGKLQFLNRLQIDNPIKWKLLLLSLLRYTVFMLQYVWVAGMLKMNIDLFSLVFSIAILFLCLSILPTISITELVVRGQVLLFLLAPFYDQKMMIIALSSLIWAVNFLFPAIIGSFLLLSYRLKR